MRSRSIDYRRWGHVGLLVTGAGSVLCLVSRRSLLGVHELLGSLFVVLVVVHLAQRRQTVSRLVGVLQRARGPRGGPTRLVWADASLAVVTVVMLASEIWDMTGRGRLGLNWHALTGLLLAFVLLPTHVARRRRRVLASSVR